MDIIWAWHRGFVAFCSFFSSISCLFSSKSSRADLACLAKDVDFRSLCEGGLRDGVLPCQAAWNYCEQQGGLTNIQRERERESEEMNIMIHNDDIWRMKLHKIIVNL